MKLYYKVRRSNNSTDKNFMEVEVNILDKKVGLFGRTMCTIEPIAGRGKLVVNENRLIIK